MEIVQFIWELPEEVFQDEADNFKITDLFRKAINKSKLVEVFGR